MLSEKTVERLSEYRRHLSDLQARGVTHVFSNLLAAETRVTAAQVRRDMMNLGLSGSTATGYSVSDLLEHLAGLLDHPHSTRVALIGTETWDAPLAFFRARPGKAVIAMAFDSDRKNRTGCAADVACIDGLLEARIRKIKSDRHSVRPGTGRQRCRAEACECRCNRNPEFCPDQAEGR